MTALKAALLSATAFTLSAGASFGDAQIIDAVAWKQGQILSAKMDGDAFSHEYNIAVGPTGVVDAALGRYDAGYEIVLMERGQRVGTAVYGEYDADFDAFLTPDNFFATAALGDHDADYEAVLEGRKPLGARFFWRGFDSASLN